jgi:hypothetical protein
VSPSPKPRAIAVAGQGRLGGALMGAFLLLFCVEVTKRAGVGPSG